MPILRYKVAELADSRLIAIEKATRRALILTPRPANGEHRLSRCGAASTLSGMLLSVKTPAACSGYQVELLPTGDALVRRVSVQGWDFTIKRQTRSSVPPPASARFAILDLLGGGLLLARPSGLYSLTSAPAPDGRYRTRIGAIITVSHSRNGDPDYDYPDDFAP